MTDCTNLASACLAVATAFPDHEAIVFAERSTSYGNLRQHALRLSTLIDYGSDGPFCGILAHRSDTAYAAVLAILAAGCAYVPLNPGFPATRNGYIARKAKLTTLVVGPECVGALRDLLATTSANFRILTLNRDRAFQALVEDFACRVIWQSAEEAPPRDTCVVIDSESPAYVLFTSGSTGEPKGVVVRHRNVARYVQGFLSSYPITPKDRLSQTFDLTFDLSVHDMFVAWNAGATLVVYPNAALADPVSYTRSQRVSVWFSVPSLAALIDSLRQAEPASLSELRLSLFCGEKLTYNTYRFWQTLAPNSRVVNLYGPTETTIALTHFEIPDGFPERATLHGGIPIGQPLPGQGLEIRRDNGSTCPIGEAGLLWLCGDQLSAGYLGDAEQTARRFVARGAALFYDTGDIAQLDQAGLLQFVGRDDGQVKIMGYRVELGEVEHALVRVTGAAQLMVEKVMLASGVEELVAVLPAAFASEKKRIRVELQKLLPTYMLPRRYVFTQNFPRNSNGKLDRNALRNQVLQSQSET